MSDNFRIEEPFETRPPRLKDLINNHVIGDVWVRACAPCYQEM